MVSDLRADEAGRLHASKCRGYSQQSKARNPHPGRRLDAVIVLNRVTKDLETAADPDVWCPYSPCVLWVDEIGDLSRQS